MSTYQGVFVGNIQIIERDMSGRVLQSHRASNVMTSGGLVLIATYLGMVPAFAQAAPVPPSYIDIGTSTTPVGRFWTTVPGKTFRTAIAGREVIGASVIYHAYLTDSANAGNVVGTYGLIAGGLVAGAGDTLFAVANEQTPFTKTPNSTVSLDWTLTVSGVVS